jgi:(R)-2-hydroxyacyl-CoA dehydratese activating ATPase
MFVAGCDVGSTTGKAVIMDKDLKVLAYSVTPSTFDPEKTSRQALEVAIEQVEGIFAIEDLGYIIGTGYGRIEVPFANDNVSEITCHAIGAHHLDSSIHTVIDIGGQDCKAMALKDDGNVLEFAMNDKCAAGTGRFFEGMGRAFNMSLDEFSKLSMKSNAPSPISSQCSVFAESEVISLVSQRKKPEDVAAGVQDSVAKRLFALARRVGVRENLTVTGGCAKNKGLMRFLEKRIKIKVTTLSMDPQLVGALGAAVLAAKK